MKKIYPTIAIVYTVLLGIVFNVVHYLRLGMSFRSPEYFYYLTVAKGITQQSPPFFLYDYLPAKYDLTQYLLKGIYKLYPSIYSVQVFSFICFVAVGITAFFLGRELFRDNKHRDQLGVIFSATLVSLHSLALLYVGLFTHDAFQIVMVLTLLYFGIRIINTKNYKLLPIPIILFIFGIHTNMSILFTIPILLLYLLRNKVDYRLLLGGITLFAVVSSYLMMQRLGYSGYIDVLPIWYYLQFENSTELILTVLAPIIIPSVLCIGGIYKTIKNKDAFFFGTFIYLFVAMLFMSRNIRWVSLPIALLIAYGLQDKLTSLTEKSIFKKIRRNGIVYILISLILLSTTTLFWIGDTEDESIAYGVHRIEIDGTAEFLKICTVHEDIDLTFFVEPDRQYLIKNYATEKTEIVYDKSLWMMTEQEAYTYVLDNRIDAVFFYPRDYNEQWYQQGDRKFPLTYSSVVNTEEMEYINKNRRFLGRIYHIPSSNYFNIATTREIRTCTRIYYFKVFCPKPPAQLYHEGIDISFLDEKD